MATMTLDTGEAAVIQLAIEQKISWVCMDEIKGRQAAKSIGLKVVGALGLLGMAKKQGLLPVVNPYVEKALKAGVYYSENLVRRVLEAVGE